MFVHGLTPSELGDIAWNMGLGELPKGEISWHIPPPQSCDTDKMDRNYNLASQKVF